MGVSRTMWLRGLREDYAKMRMNAFDDRDAKVKEITRKWKEGFKSLKDENDRMQREASESLKAELADLKASFDRSVAQGPPRD